MLLEIFRAVVHKDADPLRLTRSANMVRVQALTPLEAQGLVELPRCETAGTAPGATADIQRGVRHLFHGWRWKLGGVKNILD